MGLWSETRLFELGFVESSRRLSRLWLSPSRRSLFFHFSAANNIRQTPAFPRHRRSGNKVSHFVFFAAVKKKNASRAKADWRRTSAFLPIPCGPMAVTHLTKTLKVKCLLQLLKVKAVGVTSVTWW